LLGALAALVNFEAYLNSKKLFQPKWLKLELNPKPENQPETGPYKTTDLKTCPDYCVKSHRQKRRQKRQTPPPRY